MLSERSVIILVIIVIFIAMVTHEAGIARACKKERPVPTLFFEIKCGK